MWSKFTSFVDEFLDFLMGFRKFIAFMCVFVIGVVFRLKGYIDGGQMVDLLKNCFLGFCGANGVEHYVSMIKDQIAERTAKALEKKDETSGSA